MKANRKASKDRGGKGNINISFQIELLNPYCYSDTASAAKNLLNLPEQCYVRCKSLTKV